MKKQAKFLVLASGPLRTVHKVESLEEGKRWAKNNREYYKAIGSALCVMANEPPPRKKPKRKAIKKDVPRSTVPEGYVTGGTWTEVGRKE
jgi:hypothetical protein